MLGEDNMKSKLEASAAGRWGGEEEQGQGGKGGGGGQEKAE